jgi:di/tricarboxylate transporter
MTPDMLFVFALLVISIALFLSQRLRMDLIAILAVLALMLSGILTPAEALAGFSDPVVLIIAGLFVVGAGLVQTGLADRLARVLQRAAGTGERRLLVMIMLAVALLSAFMSSTGTVAILLPVVMTLAWEAKISPSRLLIPLAYASLLGGMLTLIGTPPNIIVSNQLAAGGLSPFGFFTFTPVGLVMVAVGVLFMVVAGGRLLPMRKGQSPASLSAGEEAAVTLSELAAAYRLPENMFRLRVRRLSPLVGSSLSRLGLRSRHGVTVIEVQSRAHEDAVPGPARPAEPGTILEAHDILLVQGDPADVARLAREQVLGVLPADASENHIVSREVGLVEVLLTPRSRLIGQTLRGARFRDLYNTTVLAIRRLGEPLSGDISTIPLRFGDTLLVEGTWRNISLLREEPNNFVVVGQPKEMKARTRRSHRAPHALVIVGLLLVLMTFDIVPAVTAVLLAAAALVLTGSVTMEEAYRSLNVESLVLIAGMLPVATALDKSGGIQFISGAMVGGLGAYGPLALMTGLFLLTSLFSQFISNTATTVLVAPIAFQAAASLGVAPQAFLMAVAVAASTSFATPIASPVNTLVLGPGNYHFGDFARLGIPLQFLMLLVSLVVLPLLFGF